MQRIPRARKSPKAKKRLPSGLKKPSAGRVGVLCRMLSKGGKVRKMSKGGSMRKMSKGGSMRKMSKGGSMRKMSKGGRMRMMSKGGRMRKMSKSGMLAGNANRRRQRARRR